MSNPLKICVFFSKGDLFVERLVAVRRRYPDAYVCAMIPARYEQAEALLKHVDEIIRTERDGYSVRTPGACARLVRQIRNRRFDLFIVMFDSAQLNLLGGLSGAKRVECWDTENRIHVLRRRVSTAALRLTGRRMWGAVRFLRVQTAIAFTARGGPDFRTQHHEIDGMAPPRAPFLKFRPGNRPLPLPDDSNNDES